MKSLKWKISSHWETEPICCSYRTEDGQKRQEKGKVCWRKPSKILFSNLFSDQFWQNGDQRRVGVCWQRRSSLQGETHQLLGFIDHRCFSCVFLGGIDHWCLSYLFLGFINHRCFSCIFLGFIDHRCFSRRSSSPTSWVIDRLGSTYIRRLSRFKQPQPQKISWEPFLFQMARQARLLADRRRSGSRTRQVRFSKKAQRGGRAAGRRRP